MSFFNSRITLIIFLLLLTGTGVAQRFYSRNYTINDGLPSNIIHAIVKDSRGILWIGTGGGLCRFDGNNFQVYNTTHGLVGDNVYSITEDKNGDLWIGCMSAGISRFDGINFRNYTTKNGLVSDKVRVVWYSKKFDILMIGTNDGCSAMEKGRFVSFTTHDWNPLAEKAHVTGFLENRHGILVYAYSTPTVVLYNPAQKRFSIHTPWYSTWWFIAVSIVMILAISSGIFSWSLRLIKKREQARNALLLQVATMEMKALQAQMKPHFIFNTINSMQYFILNHDVDKALYYLNLFSKLIRKTMENASKEFIPVIEELDYLKCYIEIEKMRFEDLFEYEMRISPDVPVESTLIPPMIVQLFVENAIKHGLMPKGLDGFLLVELKSEQKNMFKMMIQDNGVGRKRTQELNHNLKGDHKSFGLQIISDRIRLLNETHHTDAFKIVITDPEGSDGTPTGLRVEFWFPEMMV